MSGTDFRNTPLALREKLSLGTEEIKAMIEDVCRDENILGCAVVSTCNRIEIYLSCDEYFADPAELLFKRCGEKKEDYIGKLKTRYGFDAARHLSEVACGLHSAIICEEQIVTQINEAAALSREAGGMDAVLNTLFRNAVSSGKRALTECKVSAVPPSAAARMADMAEKMFGDLHGKKALVIGSGKMGCLAAETLIKRGCDVKITIRSYRSGENHIPRGAIPVEYAVRAASIADSDIVVSATRSPHFTVTVNDVMALPRKPMCIFDLAVPRDIEPGVNDIIKCFDIDDIYTEKTGIDPEVKAVYSIAEEYAEDFMQWEKFRSMLPVIEDIKSTVGERVINSHEFADIKEREDPELIAKTAAEKTADLIIKAIRESISMDELNICLERIKNGSRFSRRELYGQRGETDI